MDLSALPETIARLLRREDLAALAADTTVKVVGSLDTTFRVTPSGEVLLPPNCGLNALEGAVTVRHALELALLLRLWPAQPVLAGLAASRTAALFATLEEVPPLSSTESVSDLAPMGDAPCITAPQARKAWAKLARHQIGAPRSIGQEAFRSLQRLWPLLGPAEWLMQNGGDLRLVVDPVSFLNGYGCSHRPRPWAVSFASSTASSCSQRGYRGAEQTRQRLLRDAFYTDDAVGAALEAVRSQISQHYSIADSATIVLAPSGTDCELFALAAAQMHPSGRPVTNILVAPEETGRGVPLAAAGRHFAVDTARGVSVACGHLIEGFRDDTVIQSIPLRTPGGAVRPSCDITAECEQMVEAAVAAGRTVLLHRVDISKTGLLAPDADALLALQQRYPGQVDVVVDACQTRLTPARIHRYLADGWIVLLTGSKFLTGPPFSGAAIFPPSMQQRFSARNLPIGLRDYSGRAEWPQHMEAAAKLPLESNSGLCLRWSAALAELEAFNAVPESVKYRSIARFMSRVGAAIDASDDLLLIDVPVLDRPGAEPSWDKLRTILSFAMRTGPTEPWLTVDAAKCVFTWLNADLSRALPHLVTKRSILHQRFHSGQPAKIVLDGAEVGVLRISASARLVSGPPNRASLAWDERLELDIADAVALLEKITLILRHWPDLQRAAPVATYA
jgi:hypothetical protein